MIFEDAPKPGRLSRFTAAFAEGIGLALARFPVTSAAIAAFAAMLSLEIENVHPLGEAQWWRTETALVCAGAAAAVVALFGESRRAAVSLRLGTSLAVAVVVGALVLFGARLGVFAPPLVAAACLAVPLAPHVVGSSPLRFWTFVHWGAFGAALAFVSVLLFVLGLTAILEMVRYLFDIGIPQRAYEHLYVVACAFVGPLFALGRVPRDLTEEAVVLAPATDRLSSGLGVLQDWIAAPLALVVALVLHVYVAKIAATGELPKNQVGWIVGSFALFALSVRVAAHPFLRVGGAATRLFGRVWTATLVLPTALLAYALWLRIVDQGVTAERYYLALAALSAAAIVLAQLPQRVRGDIRVMAAIPVALLALSSFGPWGVSATVGRSQTALLRKETPTLGQGGALADRLNDEQRQTVRSRIQALNEVGALPALLPYLGEADRTAVISRDEGEQDTELLDRLGLAYGSPSPIYRSFAASKGAAFDVGRYDTVFTNVGVVGSTFPAPSAIDTPPDFIAQSGGIAVRYQGVVDRFDASLVTRALPETASAAPETVAPSVVDVRTDGGRSLRLFIRSASFDQSTSAIASLAFDVAIRRGEWPTPNGSLGGDGQRRGGG